MTNTNRRTKLQSLLFLLLLSMIPKTNSFCPENYYLHPYEIAGFACYKEEEGIICDTNTDTEGTCTQYNCDVQLGGYDKYNCAVASFYHDELNLHLANEALEPAWIAQCCFEVPPMVYGCLGNTSALEMSGDCTYENVYTTMTNEKECTDLEIFAYLNVGTSEEAESVVSELCYNASIYAESNSYNFEDISHKGYQFDHEFMNGGSDWINLESSDYASRIQYVQENVQKRITFPTYLDNFEDSCSATMAVMCCWTADQSINGEGSCADEAGCFDEEPSKNTDLCFHDIQNSPTSSHLASGMVMLDDTNENAHCMGFTWTDDDSDLNNLYKGNLLFEVAMRYGLKGNGYVRSVPHAPMCACVEQMPVVSRADCTGVASATTIWALAPDADSGFLTIEHSSTTLTISDCKYEGLLEEHAAKHGYRSSEYTILSSKLVSDCESNNMVENLQAYGYAKQTDISWIKVAGKGVYAEPDNPLHTEVLLSGTHTSMNSTYFNETIWSQSNQILLRVCKWCAQTHRYIYLRRYDETNTLPDNVDLLNIVKDGWKQFDNNMVHVDFDLYSTYDDAMNMRYAWQTINSNYNNIGFARDSGPDGYVYNQWNVWETPLLNRFYGQGDVAFYVAIQSS